MCVLRCHAELAVREPNATMLVSVGIRACVARDGRQCRAVRGCTAGQHSCTLRPVWFLSLSRSCSFAKLVRGTGGILLVIVLPLSFLSQEHLGMVEYMKLVHQDCCRVTTTIIVRGGC